MNKKDKLARKKHLKNRKRLKKTLLDSLSQAKPKKENIENVVKKPAVKKTQPKKKTSTNTGSKTTPKKTVKKKITPSKTNTKE